METAASLWSIAFLITDEAQPNLAPAPAWSYSPKSPLPPFVKGGFSSPLHPFVKGGFSSPLHPLQRGFCPTKTFHFAIGLRREDVPFAKRL
jgi:hypothetical protein